MRTAGGLNLFDLNFIIRIHFNPVKTVLPSECKQSTFGLAVRRKELESGPTTLLVTVAPRLRVVKHSYASVVDTFKAFTRNIIVLKKIHARSISEKDCTGGGGVIIQNETTSLTRLESTNEPEIVNNSY